MQTLTGKVQVLLLWCKQPAPLCGCPHRIVCFPHACRSGGEVLLLQRNSLHHHGKWGLPGGNLDDADADLLATARREATEELGGVPDYTLKGEILTK